MPFRATVWTWFADRDADPQPVRPQTGGDYQSRWLVIDEHTGTHLDAPRHFVPPPDSGLPAAGPPGDIGIADLPLLSACGPAAVVDVTALDGCARPGASPAITPEHITAWEDEHGVLGEGEVVLLHTGWDARYRPDRDGAAYGSDVLVTGSAPGWPAPRPDTVEVLRSRGCAASEPTGCRSGRPRAAPRPISPAWRTGCFVEALTGLSRLPARGSWFLFLPVKLVAGTGAPGRALAVLADVDAD
jgi:kynurenine formamidase